MSQHPDGVIHDIGYRTYEGARRGTGAIAASLFRTGLLNAYGIGRSGKAKALPMTLAAIMLVPAAISVAIMVTLGLDDGFIDYSSYPFTLQLFIVIFVAAQAPVLFSRDLRSGAIVLYLARPLRAAVFALVRWASLAVAILVFTLAPVLVLYVGAVFNEADVTEQTADLLAAVVGLVLLAAVLATVAGLVSALTTRRGFAVGAIIVALLISSGVVTAVQGIATAEGNDTVAQWAGLFSPFTLVDGVQSGLLDGTRSSIAGPESAGMDAIYLLATVLVVGVGLALLVRHYHRQGKR
ncbi:MAG: ABC transporter permease [Ornithinimicrobium sp.]|uniref:ABC transporter permease n=1 Tax=Ornithinimicrobium sp. TaxID=1977084 RepID=UPI003D9AC2F3